MPLKNNLGYRSMFIREIGICLFVKLETELIDNAARIYNFT